MKVFDSIIHHSLHRVTYVTKQKRDNKNYICYRSTNKSPILSFGECLYLLDSMENITLNKSNSEFDMFNISICSSVPHGNLPNGDAPIIENHLSIPYLPKSDIVFIQNIFKHPLKSMIINRIRDSRDRGIPIEIDTVCPANSNPPKVEQVVKNFIMNHLPKSEEDIITDKMTQKVLRDISDMIQKDECSVPVVDTLPQQTKNSERELEYKSFETYLFHATMIALKKEPLANLINTNKEINIYKYVSQVISKIFSDYLKAAKAKKYNKSIYYECFMCHRKILGIKLISPCKCKSAVHMPCLLKRTKIGSLIHCTTCHCVMTFDLETKPLSQWTENKSAKRKMWLTIIGISIYVAISFIVFVFCKDMEIYFLRHLGSTKMPTFDFSLVSYATIYFFGLFILIRWAFKYFLEWYKSNQFLKLTSYDGKKL